MDVLFYNEIDSSKVRKQFDKVVNYLQNGDFAAAEVKKMQNTGFYRAKLDYENRLLFKFAKYNEKVYLLLLEVILNHDYSKSRFLRGAEIDESNFLLISSDKQIEQHENQFISYVNPKVQHFHLLDKYISFDDDQQLLFSLHLPLIVIGSAGSGKTVLTLEKIKSLKGKILYITLSPFLIENSVRLYYSSGYENENQEVDFLSYKEFIESIKVPEGKEMDYKMFERWFNCFRHTVKIKDSHKLFEEFRGVITGTDIEKEYFSNDDYINLGVRQSVFLAHDREQVYSLFEKYLAHLNENHFFDINIISHRFLELCKPVYDFIVIDEVQDFTNIQLYLILKSLKNPSKFILCGDSNQMVHPNFFSWSKIKTMFYKNDIKGNEIRFLRTNYRNSPEVTDIANSLLKIKNLRFGSIDKESTFLVNAVGSIKGKVVFLDNTNAVKNDLNQKTRESTKFAIIVMRSEDKQEAKQYFKTPLVFSVQEAKGLEYENIILIDFISNNERDFNEITDGIQREHLESDELIYSRGKDKTDKSLDVYKFYINSFYVAITRAITNLYIIEKSSKHRIFHLLGLKESKQNVDIQKQVSNSDEWKKEARKLEKQGKTEQAEEIRQNILGTKTPEWQVLTYEKVETLEKEALDPENFNKKAKDKLFDYALVYDDVNIMRKLSQLNYRKAENYELERNSIFRRYYQYYKSDDVKIIIQQVNKYGVDFRDVFNLTPLHAAAQAGAIKIINMLLEIGANPELIDNRGRNPFQIAINHAFLSPVFISAFGKIYSLLITDNIKLKVDEQLVKIDNHKFEYLLLCLFIAIQSSAIDKKVNLLGLAGVIVDDFLDMIQKFPEIVLPDYRKERTYILANLAKNEMQSGNPYNKKLFKRISRGNYMLNPDISILTEDEWKNVYDLMHISKPPSEEEIKQKAEINFQKIMEDIKQRYPKMYEQTIPKQKNIPEIFRIKTVDKKAKAVKTENNKNVKPAKTDDSQIEFDFSG
ncbi:MAG: UvrD-helicase domain-containing protein [Bacteroidales bacterium]